ncbi:MAG: WYL domain-containing protein [Campylobacterota bacterium]|nr:WYL domain-containing protein [Campylobacterota bacterium]
MTKDYDKILTRLIFTLTKLSNDERPTLPELSEEFNVSIKTIQRDIYQRLMFFPIEKNDDDQLKFQNGFTLNQSKLSIDEIIMMSLSLDQIKDAGNEFNETAKQISSKLIAPNFFNPYYIKPQLHQSIDMDSPLLNKIEIAIEKKMLCSIEIKDSIEELRALKIVNFDGIWYLLCKEFKLNKIKTIFLADILNITYLDTTIKIDESIETLLDTHIQSAYFEDGESFEVIIKVNSNIAQYFTLKKHLPSQEILDKNEDGSVLIKFKISTDEDVDNLIKSWLPDIEVISPIRFKNKIINELEEYVQKMRLGT